MRVASLLVRTLVLLPFGVICLLPPASVSDAFDQLLDSLNRLSALKGMEDDPQIWFNRGKAWASSTLGQSSTVHQALFLKIATYRCSSPTTRCWTPLPMPEVCSLKCLTDIDMAAHEKWETWSPCLWVLDLEKGHHFGRSSTHFQPILDIRSHIQSFIASRGRGFQATSPSTDLVKKRFQQRLWFLCPFPF